MSLTKDIKNAKNALKRIAPQSAPGILTSNMTTGVIRKPISKVIRPKTSALTFAGEWNDHTQYSIGNIVIVGSNNYTGDDEHGVPVGTEGYQDILEEGFQAGTYLCFSTPPIGTTPWAQPSRHWYMLARATWPLLCVRENELSTNKIGMESTNALVQFLMWFGKQVLELNLGHVQIGESKFSVRFQKQEYCKDDKQYIQFVLATKLIDPDTMEEVNAIDEP